MPGTIVFKPIEANIISKDKDILGKMDPYLSFHLGGLKRVKGEVAKSGGQHPMWNDAITVDFTNQTSLTVDLKDKDMLIDDKIASFEVDLREVQSQGRVRKWYPIFRRNEPAGELLMEATLGGGSGQFGTGLNQGQYAGVGGLSQGQYGTGTGLNQGQYGTGTGLNQGQYGSQYGTGLSQGQGTHYAGGSTGSNVYGQSGHVITTPGTVISHTSTSYPVQGTAQTTQYSSSNLQQRTQYSSGLQQGTQYGTGLQQGTQYGTGLHQGTQHGTGLQQGTQYSAVPLGGQGSLQQGQFGSLQPSQYGTGLQQGQYGGLQQGQGYGSQISSEQFAKEALLRGSDPLNTQQNYYYNVGQGGYGGAGHQNLTQTPSFSGTDPILYEGDKNRFSNPPQQVPYGSKNVETYGHKHGKHGTGPVNPSVNPNTGGSYY